MAVETNFSRLFKYALLATGCKNKIIIPFLWNVLKERSRLYWWVCNNSKVLTKAYIRVLLYYSLQRVMKACQLFMTWNSSFSVVYTPEKISYELVTKGNDNMIMIMLTLLLWTLTCKTYLYAGEFYEPSFMFSLLWKWCSFLHNKEQKSLLSYRVWDLILFHYVFSSLQRRNLFCCKKCLAPILTHSFFLFCVSKSLYSCFMSRWYLCGKKRNIFYYMFLECNVCMYTTAWLTGF